MDAKNYRQIKRLKEIISEIETLDPKDMIKYMTVHPQGYQFKTETRRVIAVAFDDLFQIECQKNLLFRRERDIAYSIIDSALSEYQSQIEKEMLHLATLEELSETQASIKDAILAELVQTFEKREKLKQDKKEDEDRDKDEDSKIAEIYHKEKEIWRNFSRRSIAAIEREAWSSLIQNSDSVVNQSGGLSNGK